jgi:hypothetical protein
MTMLNRGSATIYQFPAGGRAGLEAAKRRTTELTLPTVTFGSGWYHDDAIDEEAARNRRPQRH